MESMNLAEIKRRKEKLERAKRNLKSYFVGLDDIIDNIISNIEIWYIMPELLSRPIVVNLWGMTGVGKTDLVRKLVRELDFEDAYVEVQMDTGSGNSGWGVQSIKHYIDTVGIQHEDPGIVLLDEMQRFRSVDEDGKMMENSKFQDIWMLLSDGKFSDSFSLKRRLMGLMVGLLYDMDEEVDDDDEDEDDEPSEVIVSSPDAPVSPKKKKKKKERKYQTWVWAAESLKHKADLKESVEEIMQWDNAKKLEVVKKRLSQLKVTKDERKYEKLLIFISGNLDAAYNMAGDVADTNIDADVLHEFSKEISVVDIKDCLLGSFKPEQIARFGNTHIIYPSLSKKSFYDLIDMKLKEIVKKTRSKFGISVTFDKKIKDCIYRNGVYPTQGVRPLFSTISSLIENTLPTFLYAAGRNKIKKIAVTVDDDDQVIVGKIGDKKVTKKIEAQLDKLVSNLSEDQVTATCVHEAGHAVAYALLFNLAPAQTVGNSVSGSRGFVIPHSNDGCKDSLQKQIQVFLAGTVAEEIVFGESLKSNGNGHDISVATKIAAEMVRVCNMDGTISHIAPPSEPRWAQASNTDIDPTNDTIEGTLRTQKEAVKKLLEDNTKLYKAIVKELLKIKRMLPHEFIKIAKKYIKDIKIKKHNFRYTNPYKDKVEEFLD